MKYENLKIKHAIRSGIIKFYGFNISSMSFIPVGQESYCYIVTNESGNKFFAKFCNKGNIIKSITEINKLLVALNQLDFIIAPIEVDNRTVFPLLDGMLYLFPYFKGDVIRSGNEKWNKELTAKMTDVMADIHKSTHLINAALPKEDFKNNFAKRFEIIQKLLKLNSITDLELSRILEGNENLITETIIQHINLGEKYRSMGVKFVLTHGDITGLNILQTKAGLKLTDWDGAMFSPAERDINFLLDNPNFSLDNYQKKAERDVIYNELCHYYGQQWSLESIIQNAEVLLQKENEFIDKKEYLDEIVEYLDHFKKETE
ncbi:MAG: hypothetical protein A2233_05690 [Candidatus Kerfeldbacteria bacterium RIFOXYA2_FULL_38_24]|uniref:Aminoglycoside phosphotransferase domain-containing protein n=1 Tax=Candidatus Kerfeldbacteria bacterium RIFOXYB2_FULL_38_14 TaxID=1798547 RepID=A0A1G2BCU9_9BACT|nr:MAG: hypothetical protein A2233_05690 [Candidatus Kerfeldbacteria bacterium RIFOXYA2_FULL_38_24]OGY87053.1 MAG: hypothetical protein A2319_01890 [Candidatus Kerfeldbacteria bacterium RIFOXYB2_FULL_38_14]OGY88806.1 MAG: hypothetical protein A2458_01445 [Candidatus Kerfeldbacteria bacterium RIFOXYC2_FULL_38_9]